MGGKDIYTLDLVIAEDLSHGQVCKGETLCLVSTTESINK